MVSSAIATWEIDLGLELFDRSGRYPVLDGGGGPASAREAGVLLAQSERGCRPSPANWPAASSRASPWPSTMTPTCPGSAPVEESASRYPRVGAGLLFPLMEDVTEAVSRATGPSRHQLPEGAPRTGSGLPFPRGRDHAAAGCLPGSPLARKTPLHESDLQGPAS